MPLREVEITVSFTARDNSSIVSRRVMSVETYTKMPYQVQQDRVAQLARAAHNDLRNTIYRQLDLRDTYYELPPRRSSDGLYEPGEAGEGDGEEE